MAVATPLILVDPGELWWAPADSAEPTHAVVGSVFSDTVTSPYIPLGATAEGTSFRYEISTEEVIVAEFADPIRVVTTARSGSITFNLADYTLSNFARATNGNTSSIVTSGTTTTTMGSYSPPAIGAEVRSTLLWMSTDKTVRIWMPKTVNAGTIESAFRKGAENATIACEFRFEIPTTGSAVPFKMLSAGVARKDT